MVTFRICTVLILLSTGILLPADTPSFFQIGISTGTDGTYLAGQRVYVKVNVRNNTPTSLRFIPQQRLPSTLEFVIKKDDKVLRNLTPMFFDAPPLAEKAVWEMAQGEGLEGTFPISDSYDLGPGKYTISVTLEQTINQFGLAQGKCTSNELSFTISDWKSKFILSRAFEKYTAGVIQTDDGRLLACFRPSYEKGEKWTYVVPFAKNIDIHDLEVSFDNQLCYVIYRKEKKMWTIRHYPPEVKELPLVECSEAKAVGPQK